MPITVELQDMFSYSLLLVALVVALVVLAGVLLLIFFVMKGKAKKPVVAKQEAKPVTPMEKPVTSEQLKQKYCAMIDDLENKCRDGKLSNRKAYQELSVILRRFVYEVTGVAVHKFTLEEMNRLNMPNLTSLITECYAPEFSVDKEGNIYDTMNKTRMVIKEWR